MESRRAALQLFECGPRAIVDVVDVPVIASGGVGIVSSACTSVRGVAQAVPTNTWLPGSMLATAVSAVATFAAWAARRGSSATTRATSSIG